MHYNGSNMGPWAITYPIARAETFVLVTKLSFIASRNKGFDGVNYAYYAKHFKHGINEH